MQAWGPRTHSQGPAPGTFTTTINITHQCTTMYITNRAKTFYYSRHICSLLISTFRTTEFRNANLKIGFGLSSKQQAEQRPLTLKNSLLKLCL